MLCRTVVQLSVLTVENILILKANIYTVVCTVSVVVKGGFYTFLTWCYTSKPELSGATSVVSRRL